MLQPGRARKIIIHLNEDTSAKRDFLYNEIFAFLYASGVSGASLLRPEAGFGFHHRVHQREGGHLVSEHMPVRIEFIETAEAVEALMPQLCAMLSDGVIEAQDTVVLKVAAEKESAV
jgi:PII-like signaling protein